MKPKVYITRKIPDEMIAMIEKECDIRMGNDWDNPVTDERGFRGKGLYIEIRRYREEEKYKLITYIPCETHYAIIRFLLKNVVDVPGIGQKEVTSTEIDEERGVYVLYVKELGEERA